MMTSDVLIVNILNSLLVLKNYMHVHMQHTMHLFPLNILSLHKLNYMLTIDDIHCMSRSRLKNTFGDNVAHSSKIYLF